MTSGDISSLVSPSNYTEPVAFRWIGTQHLIDISRAKSTRYTLLQNTIIDDRNFLKKPTAKAEFGIFNMLTSDTWARGPTQIYCTTTMIDFGKCEEYFEFVYEMDSGVVITTRGYKKIPILLGEFGGYLKVLTTVLLILSVYYSKLAKLFLFRQVYPYMKSALEETAKRIRQKEKVSSEIQNKQDYESSKNASRESIGDCFNLKKDVRDTIQRETNIVELVNKMYFLDFIKKASLQRFHLVLLPLVLLISKLKKTQSGQSSGGRGFSPLREPSGRPTLAEQPFHRGLSGRNGLSSQELSKKENLNFSDFGEIYRALKTTEPTTDLEAICSRKILSYLELVFEEK